MLIVSLTIDKLTTPKLRLPGPRYAFIRATV